MATIDWRKSLPCPYCVADMNASDVRPRDGDFSVCLFCGGVVRFAANATALEKVDIKDIPPGVLPSVRHIRRSVAAVYLNRDDIGEEEAEAFLTTQAETIQKHRKP